MEIRDRTAKGAAPAWAAGGVRAPDVTHANLCDVMHAEMSTQELMTKGRKEMQAQEESLTRAQRIVENTIEVGTKTAETLHQQGQQMERVLDALDEIKFSMKKANQVIRDITRSIATDKCGP